MGNNECATDAEARRRLQASLLPMFDTIAETTLNALRSKGGKRESLACVQSYLDGVVEVSSARYTRRSILLAIHDMKEDRETPLRFRRRTLAQLNRLKVRPIPQLKCYRDLATALLRMEVVVRLSVMQAARDAESRPAFTVPCILSWQDIRQWPQSIEGHYAGFKNAIGAAASKLHAPTVPGLTLGANLSGHILSSRLSRGAVMRPAASL